MSRRESGGVMSIARGPARVSARAHPSLHAPRGRLRDPLQDTIDISHGLDRAAALSSARLG